MTAGLAIRPVPAVACTDYCTRLQDVVMSDNQGVLRQFPISFWADNTMEIFERMGWYGFYAVSAL